jgi:hypothetical protein
VAMSALDRLAWRCRRIAPAGMVCALVLLLLCRLVVVGRWQSLLPVLALVTACVGGVAHLIVQYHSVRAGSFSATVERRGEMKWHVPMQVSLGFGWWRDQMRAQHPELRAVRRQRRPDEPDGEAE